MVINECTKVDDGIRDSTDCDIFKESLLKYITPSTSNNYNISSKDGTNLSNRSSLDFSNLGELKLK